MRRDVVSGALLISCSIALLLVMAHHPSAHALLDPARFAQQARLNTLVHGLALAFVPLLFIGLLGLSRRLGNGELPISALVAWGFGGIAAMAAGVASGFVATDVIERILATDGPTRETLRALLAYTGLVNRGFASVNAVSWGMAMVLFSVAIVATRRLSPISGVAGLLIGVGVLGSVASGMLKLGIHGFGLVVLAQSVWLVWVGVLLCRSAPTPADSA